MRGLARVSGKGISRVCLESQSKKMQRMCFASYLERDVVLITMQTMLHRNESRGLRLAGPRPDSHSWYVKDPFGNQLELVAYFKSA